jgi:glycosyltransferase involved in cell wall biosynthesis
MAAILPLGLPKVTIIMRTRDRPAFLQRALQSVQAQTWKDWQIVIVNDGGNPNEVDSVVASTGLSRNAVQTVHQSAPVGRAAACNAAIRISKSDYLTVLDDDDTWHPEFLQRCLTLLDRLPADAPVRGVVTRTVEIDEIWDDNQWREQKRLLFNHDLSAVHLADLAVENSFTINAFVYRRNVLSETGLYNEALPVMEDWEFNVRFAAEFSIAVIPECLAFYHRRLEIREGTQANSNGEELQRRMVEIKNAWIAEDLATGQRGLGWLAQHGRTRATHRRIRFLKRMLTLGLWRPP